MVWVTAYPRRAVQDRDRGDSRFNLVGEFIGVGVEGRLPGHVCEEVLRIAGDQLADLGVAECEELNIQLVEVQRGSARQREGDLVLATALPHPGRGFLRAVRPVQVGHETRLGDPGEHCDGRDVAGCGQHVPRAQHGVVQVR